jgi:hypothetical protein
MIVFCLIVLLGNVSFAQVTDIFKQINGVALWLSPGAFHHKEIDTRLSGVSIRYGVELFLGPYPDTLKTTNIKYEFGLGASFSDNYRTTIGGIEVRIPIRTIYLAAYLEFPRQNWCGIPYFGVNIGVNTDLKGTALDATASNDTGNQFQLTGNTIPVEILAGSSWKLFEGLQFFTEVSFEYLAFDSIVYKALSTNSLPAIRPRRLDFSCWHFNVGFQFAKKN